MRPSGSDGQAENSRRKLHDPLRRYGEFVGRASAGLIVVGAALLALAAVMIDLL